MLELHRDLYRDHSVQEGPPCVECGEPVDPVRYNEIGYKTCLSCGDADARAFARDLRKQVAPAYSKGAPQLITSIQSVRGIYAGFNVDSK